MDEDDQDFEKRPTPQPLDYLAPDQDEDKKRAILRARVSAGCMTAVAVVVAVPIFILSSFSLGNNRSNGSGWDALICPGIIPAFVILITAYQHFVVRRAGFLQGVLIGLCVAALLVGACFALMR
jgi:hypothetical protein